MPTNKSFFKGEPGAEDIKWFIKNELIPHVNSSYRTTNEKALCGQSLSEVFALYYFLTSPDSFNTYIICSGGFLNCEEYFNKLTNKFVETKQDKTTKIFLTHGRKDFLDPNEINKKQLSGFSKKIKRS